MNDSMQKNIVYSLFLGLVWDWAIGFGLGYPSASITPAPFKIQSLHFSCILSQFMYINLILNIIRYFIIVISYYAIHSLDTVEYLLYLFEHVVK